MHAATLPAIAHTDDTEEDTQRHHLIIGGDSEYPPFDYLDEEGNPTGFSVDLIHAIANKLDIEVEIRLKPWTEVLAALESGEVDAILGMFYSEERDKKFDFSPPHIVNHLVAVVRKNAGKPPVQVADLHGKRLVVQRDDIMHEFAIQSGLEESIQLVSSPTQALRELAEGKHDCALLSRPVALYWIKKNQWDTLLVGQHP
ncbi:MAG: transporter substrate-binding domain-containing protein, partial [bacterium]|nr:transporter substrate-binding domain-containing protein [bacterium]